MNRQGKPEQVAVIAGRRAGDGIEICLIRRIDSEQWAVPKGFIDPGSSAGEAALVEAFEEAGLKGHLLGDAIGTYAYEKRGFEYIVAVHVMRVSRVLATWDEMGFRERRWAPVPEARALLGGHPVAPHLDRAMLELDGSGA